MIFSRLDRGHESHKERNFYTKVFAGCLFNELLSSYEHTSTGFLDLLHTRYGQLSEEIPGAVVSDVASEILRKLAYSKPPMSLTFDYHAYQLDKNADNGELGDIVIFTPDSSVCIEAKLYDDWCFHEDFAANRRRIETVSELTSLHGI
ncbi:MAG: hypothetical protein KGZ53_08675, partial [Peptococcaceae bacterium]|nr:hypothetical protein [Peptococcaceae bacterium]